MNRETVHEEEYKGYKIEILPDQDAINPREHDCSLGAMVSFHPNYILGDKHSYQNTDDLFNSLLEEKLEWSEKVTRLNDKLWESIDKEVFKKGEIRREYHRLIIENLETHFIILPIFCYEHSSISIQTHPYSCRWDSGQVGWIYISKEKIRKEYNIKRVTKAWTEKIKTYLTGEVETFNQYLTGDVYGYVVSKPLPFTKVYDPALDIQDVEDIEYEEVDSCWNFYGQEYCIEEAKSQIDYLTKEATIE